MKKIKKDEYFTLSSEKRKKAAKTVIKKLKNGPVEKRKIVDHLEENIYKQRGTAKTFIQNMILSSNQVVTSKGREKICLKRRKEEKQ
jgi:hypothetical protein